MLLVRVFLFFLIVAGLAAFIFWLLSAKTRRVAAALDHNHEMDEIATDKLVEKYNKEEKKARKNG